LGASISAFATYQFIAVVMDALVNKRPIIRVYFEQIRLLTLAAEKQKNLEKNNVVDNKL